MCMSDGVNKAKTYLLIEYSTVDYFEMFFSTQFFYQAICTHKTMKKPK